MVHSIWRTKFWKISNVLGNNWYPRVFRVAAYESAVRLGKFKMADQVWLGKFWKHLNFLEKKWFIRVFRVTDYESAVRLGKFKMAAQFNRQNWYTRVFRVADYEDSILQFLKCPIQNCKTKKKQQNDDSQQLSTSLWWETDSISYNGETRYKSNYRLHT